MSPDWIAKSADLDQRPFCVCIVRVCRIRCGYILKAKVSKNQKCNIVTFIINTRIISKSTEEDSFKWVIYSINILKQLHIDIII
jgi:hypothetical protein